jgi:hypothetical protein
MPRGRNKVQRLMVRNKQPGPAAIFRCGCCGSGHRSCLAFGNKEMVCLTLPAPPPVQELVSAADAAQRSLTLQLSGGVLGSDKWVRKLGRQSPWVTVMKD